MFLLTYSEPVLKGKATRRRMESVLMNNISAAFQSVGMCGRMRKLGGVILLKIRREEKVLERLRKLFGLSTIMPCDEAEATIENIARMTLKVAEGFPPGSSFALRVRRAGEHPFTSRDVAIKVGNEIRKRMRLYVDLERPKNEIFIDIRGRRAFISTEVVKGEGGLPLGTQGRMACLCNNLGRAIVAAWMMMRRGSAITLFGPNEVCREAYKTLKTWHLGKSLLHEEVPLEYERACKKVAEDGLHGLIIPDSFRMNYNKICKARKVCSIPMYWPLEGIDSKGIKKILDKIVS